MIPYILNSIQTNNHRLSDNSADKSALKTIRYVIIFSLNDFE